jgi:hypothetical protein
MNRLRPQLNQLESRDLPAPVSFANPILLNPVIGPPEQLLAGDLNGDGRTDLVAISRLFAAGSTNSGSMQAGVAIYLNSTDGLQFSRTFFDRSSVLLSPQLADVDRDGRLDLVAVARNSGSGFASIVIYSNLAASTTITPSRTIFDPRTIQVQVGDFDRDGWLDLASLSNNPVEQITIRYGGASNPFSRQTSVVVPGDTSSSEGRLMVGDLDGNGTLDLVDLNTGTRRVTPVFTEPNGSLRVGSSTSTPNLNAGQLIDLNNDGQLDLIGVAGTENRLVAYTNQNGVFAFRESLSVGRSPSSISVGDLNGDQRLDLVVGNFADDTITVLHGTPTGSFNDRRDFAVGPTSEAIRLAPSSVVLADFNGDRRLDLGVGNGNVAAFSNNDRSNSITVLNNVTTPPLVGQFQLSSSSYSVSESAQTVTIEVQRINGSSGVATVQLIGYTPSTMINGATPTVDYLGGLRTLTFNDGETVKRATFSIYEDTVAEANEQFQLFLLNPTNGATLVSTQFTGTVTIIDNDQPNLRISSAFLTDVNGVRLNTRPAPGTVAYVQVVYTVTNLPAGQSYVIDSILDGRSNRSTVCFGAGSPGTTFWVHRFLVGTLTQGRHLFDVRLDADQQIAESSEVDNRYAQYFDTTQPGRLSFSSRTYRYSPTSDEITIRINRENGSEGVIEVVLPNVFLNGAAQPGIDFTGTGRTVRFENGQTYAEITIRLLTPEARRKQIPLFLFAPTNGAELGEIRYAFIQ